MNFFGLGFPEILIILVVVLLFFGKDRLPDLARSIGKSFRELRSGFDDTKKTSSESGNIAKAENDTHGEQSEK